MLEFIMIVTLLFMFLWLVRLQAELDDVKRDAAIAEHLYANNIGEFDRLLKEYKDEWKG